MERTDMKPTNQLLFAAVIILLVGTAAFYAGAQTATGRALFAYPMKGQTPEQENADRAACHDWAVAQTGFDPEPVFAAQQAGISTRAIVASGTRACVPSYEHPCYPQGGIGGARGNAEVRRINDLYDAYLRAGQTCLEARGYQVSR
jgi:hypothetical protein